MNKNFKLNEIVICDFGINKGREFEIKAILKDSYSLQATDGKDNKYYGYDDRTLRKKA